MLRLIVIVCLFVFLNVFESEASVKLMTRTGGKEGPLIISPAYPHDSRGETVYEVQGEDQKNVPVVPGAFQPPELLKLQKMHFPRSLDHEHDHGGVTLHFVIAADGDPVDAAVPDATDPEVARAALESLARSRFKAATLNGTPIAVRIRMMFDFERKN